MTTAELTEVWIYDIESPKAAFQVRAKKVGQEIWKEWDISPYKNEIDSLVKWLREEHIQYMAGFNNISFDWQVMQYLLDNHEKWYDRTGKEIAAMLNAFATEIISNQDYDILPPYKEPYFDIPQIDLGRVHNFFNENKRTSLKWIEFMTDEIVDEMDFSHTIEYMTEDEVTAMGDYCKHDVRATETLWMYTIGQCDNTLYKGKDKIQERLDAMEEFGLPKTAISYSDVKIGEAVNLQGYMKEAGIQHIGKLYEKKKLRKKKEFTFGECIPKYVKFNSPEMNEVYKRVKDHRVNITKKEEFPFTYHGLEYTVAKGGIHSVNLPEVLESTDEYDLIEFDAGSQYPCAIVKRGKYPSHLGKEWLTNYKKLIQKRLEAKDLGKKDVRFKGIAETLKVSVNGGGFGMTNSTFSVQYDPFVHFQCTIGNQFEILMLIEWMTEAGIQVLSANTDGALCKVPKKLNEEFYRLCKKWEDVVGITEVGMGELEYTIYKRYVMTTVNDYLAIKDNGELKLKGDFGVDYLLEKNKSRRIVPIALQAYYTEGIPVEDTINNHKSIWDFCIAKKASRDYYYQHVHRDAGKVTRYNKIIRYYVSKGDGKLYKMKHEHSDKNGPKQSQCESKSSSQTIFNVPFEVKEFSEYNVDTEHYIQLAKEMIYKLDKEMQRADKIKASGALQLFS